MTSRLPYNAARGSDPDLANRRTANGSSQELYGVQPNFQQGLSSVQQQQQQQRGRHYSTDSSMSGSQESLAIEMNPYQQQQALFAASGAAAQQQAQQQAQAQQQHMLQHPHRNMPSMMMDPFYQQAPQSGVTMTRKKIVKRLELFRGYLISGGEWAMMA